MVKYWFEKWQVICELDKGVYFVVNGCWSFTVDEKGYRYFEHTKERVSETKDKPIEVTYESFQEIQPNFGYW